MALLFFASSPSLVSATHSWGGYHWARTANPFTLKLGDNVATKWDTYLATTASDWSVSNVLDTTVVPGGTTFSPRLCRATSGRVEICNYIYGKNGWLGMAQIWVKGSHIVQGAVKINDTYFNTTTYNTPAWKNLVMCQEVGHTLGLDHQDEVFNNPNLETCMDYTSDPSTNQHPNQHDYDQLELIYGHLDTLTTVQSGTQRLPLVFTLPREVPEEMLEMRSQWGKLLKDNGKVALFHRDFGASKLFTFVVWAQE